MRKTDPKIVPAIMIGGSGTRLWPLSRSNRPKQFLRLTNDASLFQNTLKRVDRPQFTRPWLLSGATHIDMVNTQINEIGAKAQGIILEPCQRGTAAALAAMALVLAGKDPETLILAMPADHIVENHEKFCQSVETALALAETGHIVTFGIVPTKPETGFGYIRPGPACHVNGVPVGALVQQPGGFLEKPTLEKAQQFVEEGYLWNAGIFLFKAQTMIEELKHYAPATYDAVARSLERGSKRTLQDHDVFLPDEDCFAASPKDVPIDTAVLEKSDRIAVVPCHTIGWADIGSLCALWDLEVKDEKGNALKGDGLVNNSSNCFVHALSGRKVVVSHVKDLMVIDAEDTVVILPNHQAQKIKDIVNILKSQKAAQINYTYSAVKSWGTIKIERVCETNHVCMVCLSKEDSLYYRVSGVECENWFLHGSGKVEYIVDGIRKPFQPGVPVTLYAGQVVSIVNHADTAEFTYLRHRPDECLDIEDWFPHVTQVKMQQPAIA